MSPLRARLLARIRADGPLRLDAFITAALQDAGAGYYTTRDPLGRDFATAPEISQMVGELLGLWAAQVRADQRLGRFALVELGPGRGTLMADALRAAARAPGFVDAAEIWFVETSPVLRSAQTRAVPAARHADRVDDLPDGPVIVLANEFFDALPIRQFVREPDGWAEVVVASQGEALAFARTPPSPDPELDRRFPGAAEGAVVETCAPAEAVAAALAPRIAGGGALLALDYGAWEGTGDTLQAIAQGAPTHPLADPGGADLTAHVAFRWIAEASGLRPGFASQGAFLERLGITARAQALARAGASGIAAAHRRLTHPDEMGTLFKALGLAPRNAPPLPGLEEP